MAPSQRRRSIDSSSSSSSGFPPGTHDHQSYPLDKKTPSEPAQVGSRHTTSGDAQSSLPNANVSHQQHESPPGYTPSTSTTVTTTVARPPIPPSGYRIPLSVPGPPFPGVERTGEAPFKDLNGTPVFIGSALMQYSVHPCKITPNDFRSCYVSFGGSEITHQGRYDLLPFVPEHMEFVPTSFGRVPPGRRPIKGGFESDGPELYHAVAVINGVKVPGKTGTHLGGCNVPFGGEEHHVKEKYEILCWRF